MHRKKSLTLLLFLLILIFPAGAAAQSELVLDRVIIELWPEYDRPEMLVLYRISLPETTPLPAPLTIRIPVEAGEPNAVAALVEGRLVSLTYQRRVEGEWAEIVFQTNSSFVQLEYYDPGLNKDGVDRHFSYTWAGDYAVSDFGVKIQVPFGVAALEITPEMSGPSPAEDGLNYYGNEFTSLAAGETLEIELAYRKNGDTLTTEFLFPSETAGDQPAAADSAKANSISIWAMVGIGVGVLMIVSGLLYNSGALSFGESRKKSDYRAKKRAAQTGRKAGGGFCHNCGTPAPAGDRFCRECGAKLRV